MGSRGSTPKSVRGLIRRIPQVNPLWGAERIRGELLKLGIAVGNRSIRRRRWRTFLANRWPRIWASDLFTVETLTFTMLDVRLFVSHARRELVRSWRRAPESSRRPHGLRRAVRPYRAPHGPRLEGGSIGLPATKVRVPKVRGLGQAGGWWAYQR